jgi:hypothetical protein
MIQEGVSSFDHEPVSQLLLQRKVNREKNICDMVNKNILSLRSAKFH